MPSRDDLRHRSLLTDASFYNLVALSLRSILTFGFSLSSVPPRRFPAYLAATNFALTYPVFL